MAVLRHNGIAVFVPPRQVGCGMAPLAMGDAEVGQKAADFLRVRVGDLTHEQLGADANDFAGLHEKVLLVLQVSSPLSDPTREFSRQTSKGRASSRRIGCGSESVRRW